MIDNQPKPGRRIRCRVVSLFAMLLDAYVRPSSTWRRIAAEVAERERLDAEEQR